MFSLSRIIASVLAGAALVLSPMQARALKPVPKQSVALPNAPFSVLPAKEVIKRYKLVSLLSPLARKSEDTLSEFAEVEKAIVFEGNVTLDENINILHIASKKTLSKKTLSTFEDALLESDRLIVVNGDLDCRGLDTGMMHGVFVLGNVNCETVSLGMAHFYVKGNLVARKYLLGSAEDDEGYGNEGEQQVRVDGTVSAPKVRTWHFGLGHLKFAKNSAEEVLVEQEDRQSSGPCNRDKDC
ncbi:hypothetical protein RBA41_33040 [Massilia sp. CCM 9210]|uniref:hypothetical protein n=1 Tax=Massilia scottii TaxID=3057166 RepID=UPI0027969122|nr:hypothetical protein [Massilia sp. CCM 9210]MDQ1818136.1 hypothetical protein [Massilia sp. CCM 9210]